MFFCVIFFRSYSENCRRWVRIPFSHLKYCTLSIYCASFKWRSNGKWNVQDFSLHTHFDWIGFASVIFFSHQINSKCAIISFKYIACREHATNLLIRMKKGLTLKKLIVWDVCHILSTLRLCVLSFTNFITMKCICLNFLIHNATKKHSNESNTLALLFKGNVPWTASLMLCRNNWKQLRV